MILKKPSFCKNEKISFNSNVKSKLQEPHSYKVTLGIDLTFFCGMEKTMILKITFNQIDSSTIDGNVEFVHNQ